MKKPDYRTMSCQEIRDFAYLENIKRRLGAPWIDIYQQLANIAARKVGRARATFYEFRPVSEPIVLRNYPGSKEFGSYFEAICEVALPIDWAISNNTQQPIVEKDCLVPCTDPPENRSTAPPAG